MLISHLFLVLEVWDGKPIYRKSWAGNLLVWSDLTLGRSDLGEVTCYFHRKDKKGSFDVVRFHLGLVLQS